MQTVAVFFGGRSTEHDVSIITALSSVIKPLELTKSYAVVPIYIAKDGAWYSDPVLKDISVYTSGKIKDFIAKAQPVTLQFDGGFKLVKTGGLTSRSSSVNIDIAFPAMHGTYGEDGALMGLLDMAGIPYVGCNTAAAAIAMDKVLTKQIAVANNLPVSKFLAFTKHDVVSASKETTKRITAKLNFPLFVKPAHLGSSIGINRVTNNTELANALAVAAHYDDRIIVEEAVNNLIEVTLPVMGNDEPRAALLEKPLTQAEDFFDFETKYMQGGKKGKGQKGSEGAHGYSQLPAELPKAMYAKAEALGLAVYKAIGASGTARIDMLIDSKTGTVYCNEVNPLPGGLYAHNWNQAGVSSVALVEKLIEYALERHAARTDLATSFSTSYLQQF